MIQGYTGQIDMWANRTIFEPTMFERLDAMFAEGGCPDAIVVFVDCWTSFGGSQFLNSSATGPYQDYLCDEVVPSSTSATRPPQSATAAASPASPPADTARWSCR